MDPTIDPTKEPVLRVSLPPLDEEDDELAAAGEVDEACDADFGKTEVAAFGAALSPLLLVLVEGTSAT